MSNSITLPSPAKLNLFLHIVGRRPDGYHELQTLFQFLDYGDEITFTLTPGMPAYALRNRFPGYLTTTTSLFAQPVPWPNAPAMHCPA